MSSKVEALTPVTSQTSSTPTVVSCSHVVSAASSTTTSYVCWSVISNGGGRGCYGGGGWAGEDRTGEFPNFSQPLLLGPILAGVAYQDAAGSVLVRCLPEEPEHVDFPANRPPTRICYCMPDPNDYQVRRVSHPALIPCSASVISGSPDVLSPTCSHKECVDVHGIHRYWLICS
ncbi:hypothetical protein PIB30_039595 [Stylosanthes scabra]|uniref:Uncharacterized protein n=1 Tax=Stylosanthes scabra TaxID=79078 RepID=A0ABU6YEN3_9FABA|nr:hypothetical protein [Stylosanthes scabra]